MDASISDFLIQLAGIAAIGGFGYLVYSLNQNQEKDT